MGDYADWFESTFTSGGGGEDDMTDDVEEVGERGSGGGLYERDAVLCIVDCSPSMFTPSIPTSPPQAAAGGVKSEPTSAVPPPGGTIGLGPAAPSTSAATPFFQSMLAIRQLYREKVLTSERDVLSLMLYNTRHAHNVGHFRGVYVLHPFHLLGAKSIREVEELGAAGEVGSAAYDHFQSVIGSADPSSAAPVLLSDALWAAHHSFLHRRLKDSKYRRVFLFLDQPDPSRGSVQERERCFARVRDLAFIGVQLEVFNVGGHSQAAMEAPFWRPLLEQASTAASQLLASSQQREPSQQQRRPYVGAVHHEDPSAVFGSLGESILVKAHPQTPLTKTTLRIGVRSRWQPTTPSSSTKRDTAAAEAAGDGRSTTTTTKLEEGGGEGSGLRVPLLSVSIYTPILPATGQKATKLDASTNRRVATRSELWRRTTTTTAADADTDAAASSPPTPVQPDEVSYATTVAQQVIFLPPDERRAMASVAGGGGKSSRLGLTLICLKPHSEVVRHELNVKRPYFVRCAASSLEEGGDVADDGAQYTLFHTLVHSMAQRQLVGIAEYVSRQGTAPRLVALIPLLPPSPPEIDGATRTRMEGPVEGTGFYMMPLPYAEDLRGPPPLPTVTTKKPATTTRRTAAKPAIPTASPIPSEEDVRLACGVVEALTVPYDLQAVPNPALQRQQLVLQDLAVGVGSSSAQNPYATSVSGNDADHRNSSSSIDVWRDWSLPDAAGMRKLDPMLHTFHRQVVCVGDDSVFHSYQPEVLCASATSRTKVEAVAVTKTEDGAPSATVVPLDAIQQTKPVKRPRSASTAPAKAPPTPRKTARVKKESNAD